MSNIVMLPKFNSINKLRNELEKMVDSVAMVEQLQQISYDSASDEYREYNLTSRTEKQGIDSGDVEDMLTVYHQWKADDSDKSFKVFLEYEQFEYADKVMYPSGNSVEVGLLLKIIK